MLPVSSDRRFEIVYNNNKKKNNRNKQKGARKVEILTINLVISVSNWVLSFLAAKAQRET